MTKREKPRGVPEEAWFHEEWGEWILGKKQGDACVGEWRQWHATRGHLTCIDVFDDDGELIHVTRFHPDGTFSQKVPHERGTPHGVGEYQRSKHPTEERMMENVPCAAAFRMQLFWEHGEQPRPARFFDEEGHEIGLTGQRKPAGIPEPARSNEHGQWVITKDVLQDAYDGVDRAWRADGSLMFETHYDADKIVRARHFHPDGTPASERDYRTKTGWYRKPAGDSDIEAPKMPGDAHEVRYRIDVVNAKTGLYWPRDQVFYDASGNELSDRGLTIRKPHDDAHLVTDGSWREPKTYWCHADEVDGLRTTSYWTQDGAPVMQLLERGADPVGFRWHDDEGVLRIEETFQPGKRGARERLEHRSVTLHTDDGRLQIMCRDDGTCARFDTYCAGALASSIDDAGLDDLTLERFKVEFERRFAIPVAMRWVVVWFDSFEIMGLEMQSEDKFFAATALTGDGGGNSAVLVQQGKHAGKIYFLDHEEGLFSLDCVDDYIDDEGLDKTMSKDELIEAMPFFQHEVAPNLGAFLRGIRVGAHATYYKRLEDFKPLES